MFQDTDDMFDPQLQQMLEMSPQTENNDLGNTRDNDDGDINNNNNKSGNNNMEGRPGDVDDQNPDQPPQKRSYHRHTPQQIQEMEALFKACPHPDDSQRKALSRVVGLDPLQIKFWFQNKRTQMKTQQERYENAILRAENDKLRAENNSYKEALNKVTCPQCGGSAAVGEMSFDEQQLRLENARLKEEVDKMKAMATHYGAGKPMTDSFPNLPFQSHDLGVGNSNEPHSSMMGQMYGGSDLFSSLTVPAADSTDKPLIVELAIAAMEELTRLAQAGEPLWVPNTSDHLTEILNEDAYLLIFPKGIGPKPLGLKSEASRESLMVIMNPINLVEILMDANQWSTMFCGIVSRAVTLEVLSTGVAGNYNGALQVMSAEFQVPSPLVPTRESYFVRYCKQHQDGAWAVVDVSLDTLRPSDNLRCRRRPSGCLIQELPNGSCKVTWVEHVEVDDSAVHSLYKLVVNSGLAFGAKRWVAALDRQCDRLASSMAINIPTVDLYAIPSIEGRKSMLKLTERMIMSFCTVVGASTAHAWVTIPRTGCDDVRVMTRNSVNDLGRPAGIVLCAATTFWLPVPPRRAFDFLHGQNSRSQWDILSNGGLLEEVAHIANGRDPGNCVSLLRVDSANTSQSNMLILQESIIDSIGSYIVYAPVDVAAMNLVLNGGDPDYVALLPSGFAILPDGPGPNGGPIPDVGSGGCLLTVAFQILVDSVPTAKLTTDSVTTVNSLIKCTAEKIKAAVVM